MNTKITLTPEELAAVLWAVGNFTDGNARDIDEMMACGLTRDEARAMLRAEAKMQKKPRRKAARRYRGEVQDDTPCLDDSFHRHEMDI